jgi:DNA topoisomerase-1
MAIPPAWQHVWISPFPDSHLQATGRDARNRKQYRYHPRWRNLRDQTKYGRMILVGAILPKLRARVAKDLAVPGLPRAKVIATVVKLLETTLIRIGNIEYARENNSFGLTTMRNRHVKVRGSKIRFRFHGKSGIDHEIDLSDKKLAQIVRRCQELPGQELFQYFDADGKPSGINSSDINDYLREATGFDLTAKDFRTWAGTVLAMRAFGNIEQATSKTQAKRNIVQAVEIVARQLGNTRTVCQKCYIHPAIVNAYLDGSLAKVLARQSRRARTELPQRLTPAESTVMAILNQTQVIEPNQKVA